MARMMNTDAALAKLAQLYDAEHALVAKLREANVGALPIAKAMHTSPQGIAKRFPAGSPSTRVGGRTAAAARPGRTAAKATRRVPVTRTRKAPARATAKRRAPARAR